jgi:hypothetical protein
MATHAITYPMRILNVLGPLLTSVIGLVIIWWYLLTQLSCYSIPCNTSLFYNMLPWAFTIAVLFGDFLLIIKPNHNKQTGAYILIVSVIVYCLFAYPFIAESLIREWPWSLILILLLPLYSPLMFGILLNAFSGILLFRYMKN